MYTDNFKKRLFSSTWRISVAQGMIHMNILPSCGHICISGFRCRLSVTNSVIINIFGQLL